jgi:hypothetical protein
MDVVGHENEGVQKIRTFAAVMKESFEKQSGIGFDRKQVAMMPGTESQEISSGRRKES